MVITMVIKGIYGVDYRKLKDLGWRRKPLNKVQLIFFYSSHATAHGLWWQRRAMIATTATTSKRQKWLPFYSVDVKIFSFFPHI